MKLLTLTAMILFCSILAFGQRYKTKGIEHYQKNINGKYVLINRVLNYEAEWTFYSDNTFHCYKEGQNCGDYKIDKKTKVGNKTTYTINLYGLDVKIVVEGTLLTWIEGEDGETKNVYRIIKTEKAE